jgi:hypothetical protein
LEKEWKKKLIEMSEDDEVPIILENISHFYNYLFVSYFPSLHPTLHPNKSPYLISRNVWFRNFHNLLMSGVNYFQHPFMRLLVLSWLSSFHMIHMWDVWFLLILFHSHMLESVTPISEWFHLLSVNTSKAWIKT